MHKGGGRQYAREKQGLGRQHIFVSLHDRSDLAETIIVGILPRDKV
jgi:hypothetical protein